MTTLETKLLAALKRLLDAPEQMEWGEPVRNITERSAARALAWAAIEEAESMPAREVAERGQ